MDDNASTHSAPTTVDAAAPIAAPMREALALAAQAIGLSEPNPRVGCVIVAADGTVVGRGHTQEAGGPHAEVMALRDAAAAAPTCAARRSTSPSSLARTTAARRRAPTRSSRPASAAS